MSYDWVRNQMKISSKSDGSIEKLSVGHKEKQRGIWLYIPIAGIIAGIFIAEVIFLINGNKIFQHPTSLVTKEREADIHKIQHTINLSAKEWVKKGLSLLKAKPYKEGIEASKQAIQIKPDNEEAHSTLNPSDLILEDKDSAIEAYEVLKQPPPKKTNSLNRNSNPIDLLENDALQKVTYNNIVAKSKTIGGSMLNNHNEAYQTFYTIQTGSFKNKMYAQRQFNTLIKFSYKKDFNHLRIERIDNFNVVRFGKYDGYSHAAKLIKEIKPYISNAFILEAYIKYENIIKLHKK
jgi:tetratricopeptide (TPR) repeat protein